MSIILLVGAADTGRAPMAAALLRRLLGMRAHPWTVESAGVLGHDGAAAEVEARDTMVHLGLDIGAHEARSITDAIVSQAALIVAIDHGTLLVVRARFADAASRTYSLGELAGRQRDVPDPFRMQIGAWMTYARELDGLLTAALPRMAELMPVAEEPKNLRTENQERAPAGSTKNQEPRTAEPRTAEPQNPNANLQSPISNLPPPQRADAAGRIAQVLQIASQMPGVVDWSVARPRIEADLALIAAAPQDPGDLIVAYAALLRAAMALLPAAPSTGQLTALHRLSARLAHPIGQTDLNDMSAQIALLPSLP